MNFKNICSDMSSFIALFPNKIKLNLLPWIISVKVYLLLLNHIYENINFPLKCPKKIGIPTNILIKSLYKQLK